MMRASGCLTRPRPPRPASLPRSTRPSCNSHRTSMRRVRRTQHGLFVITDMRRKPAMPQFWKLDALQWLNPAHIVHVEDAPQLEPPTLRVKMLTLEPTVEGRAAEPYTLVLTGETRDTVLAYLARETESPPPPPPA